jgi:restriction system protein
MVDPSLTAAFNGVFPGLFKMFLNLWWVWLLVIAASIIPAVIERKRQDKKYSAINDIHSDKNLLLKLRGLKPSKFEDYIAHLFNKMGFTTEPVGGSYDGGIDVIAEKDGVKHYIQCKKYITSQVSVGDVRNFYGALVDHLANGKGYFITTNKFTLEAEKFAEDKSIELIDGYRLLEYIKLFGADNRDIKVNAEESSKCPKCGGGLVKKNGKYGPFYGCSNFPKCKHTQK